LNMILLWFFLERKVSDLNSSEIFVSGVKIVIASFFAGLAAYGALQFMDKLVSTRTVLGIFSQGLAAGIIGIAAYFFVGLLLRSPEIKTFWDSIKNRLPFKSVAPDKEMIDQG